MTPPCSGLGSTMSAVVSGNAFTERALPVPNLLSWAQCTTLHEAPWGREAGGQKLFCRPGSGGAWGSDTCSSSETGLFTAPRSSRQVFRPMI